MGISLKKQIMATAIAVASLALGGNYASAVDNNSPAQIMQTINSATKHKSGYKYKKVAPKHMFVNRFSNKINSSGGAITGFAAPTPTRGSDAVYTITEGTSTDYNFAIDGNYYKISFPGHTTNLVTITETNPGTVPGKTTGNFEITLPHETTPRKLYYSYNTSGDVYAGQTSHVSYTEENQTINRDFINNSASEDGGAVYNYRSNLTLKGSYIKNTSYNNGGAVYSGNTIKSITGEFIGNSANGYGGAIYNENGTITTISADFINNSARYGGAIYNSKNRHIGTITGDFIKNIATPTSVSSTPSGGVIYNSGTINSITGNFVGNLSQGPSSYGGSIYNQGTINSIAGDFVGNYSLGTSSYGGAIYNGGLSIDPSYNENSKITLGNSTFTGNYVQVGSTQTPNSIYNAGIITIADGATVTINDGYDGLADAKLNIGTGSIFNLSVDKNGIHNNNLGKVTNNGTINWDLDIDFGTKKTDTISAASLSGNTSIIIRSICSITMSTVVPSDGETINILASSNPISASVFEITGGTLKTQIAGNWYDVTYTSADGLLHFAVGEAPPITKDTLAETTVTTDGGDTAVKEYTLPTGGETVVADSGLGTLVGSKLTITGNNKAILGSGKAGMTLGTGTQEQTLIVNNVSGWSGHDGDSITTGSKANLEITDSSIASIAGTAKSMKFTGTNTIASDISSSTVSNKGALALGTKNLTATGTFTNGASDTTSASITAGTVTVKGADSANYGTITGNVVVDGGELTNNNTITGNVTTQNSGSLTSSLANITGDLTNNATFNLKGNLTKNILGASGTTVLTENIDVTTSNIIEGTLDLNGKTVNMQSADLSTSDPAYVYTDSTTPTAPTFQTLTVGSLNGNGNLKIDVDMETVGGKAKSSDKITISSGSANSGTINLSSINVTNSGTISETVYNDYITYVDDKTTGLTYNLTATSTITSDNHKFEFTKGSLGKLNAKISATELSLRDFIVGVDPTVDTFSLTDNLEVIESSGTTARTGGTPNELFLNLNGYKLSAKLNSSDAPQYSGATVDKGYTLHVDGTGTTNGQVSGFTTAFSTNAGEGTTPAGVLTVNNVTFSGNTTDIANNGKTEFTGTNTVNTMTGGGTTEVKGGTTTFAGTTADTINQKAITVSAGKLKANANVFNVTDGITNSAEVELTGGELDTTITGGNITISGAVTSNASNLAGAIANNTANNELTLTGGNISGAISGAGKTIISGNVANTSASNTLGNAVTVNSGAKLTTVAGAIANTVSGAASAATTPIVELSGGTLGNYTISGAKVVLTGDVTANANNLAGTETNNAGSKLTLNGGDLKANITGAGNTEIAGTVTNTTDKTVANALTVASGSFTTKANVLNNSVTNNVANGLVLTGGNLGQNVTGTNGSTQITGAVAIDDSTKSIAQAINIASTGSLKANAGSIKGAVTDNVASGSTGLVLTGGELAYNVTGTGTTDIGTTAAPATVTNNAKISTPITIQGESRLITAGSNADTAGDATSGIVGAVTNEAGTLQLTGGKVLAEVSGAGTTKVTGMVTNNSTIGNAVEITGSGNLTTATSGLTSETPTKNAGTLVFNDSANGTLGQKIEKNGENGGTVEIATTNGAVIDMNGNTITDNIIKLTSGTLKAGSSTGAVDLSGAEKIVANGGNLSVQDGKNGTITLGNIDTTSSALKVAIDADFTAGPNGSADKISIKEESTYEGSNKIAIYDIKITDNKETNPKDPVETIFNAQIADDSAKANIDLMATTLTGLTDGAGSLLLTYDDQTGYLTGRHTDLDNAIKSTITTKLYNIGTPTTDSVIDNTSGALELGGTSLSVTGNGAVITSSITSSAPADRKDGIDVNGKTLSIANATIGSATNGFGTAIDNSDAGKVTLNGVTMTGNTVDVVNTGEDEKGLFIVGTSTLDKVYDSATGATGAKGQTTIGNGDATTDTVTIGEIIQKNVNVKSDGVLNIAADKLQTTAGTDNAGTLNLSGTSGETAPSVLASAISNETGTTNIAGNVATSDGTSGAGKNITQNAINIGSNGTTTPVNGSLTNNNTVKANNITVNSGSTLENNSQIAAVDDSGTATIDAKAGSSVELNNGSEAKANLTLEGTDASKSMLAITDSGKLNGNVISDNGATIELIADDEDIKMSSAITGAISGSTAGSNGVYAIVAQSIPDTTPATVHSVTIDKEIAGATSILVEDETKATITDTAIGSNTTAPINVSKDAELTLKNTTSGTMNVGNAISKSPDASADDSYDVIVNNSANGETNINNTISGAKTVTGDGGTTNLKSTITGADTIIAKAGTTNIDAGTNVNTSSRIGTADIEVENGATAGVKTTSDNFILDSDVEGESSTATLQLNGKPGTAESPTEVGTQFIISSEINGGTVELANGQLNLPTEGTLTNAEGLRIDGGATLNTMNGSTSEFNKPTEFKDGAQLKIDADVFARTTDKFLNPTEGTNEKLTDLSIQGLDKIYNTRSVNLTSETGLNNLQAGEGLSDLISSRYPQVITPVRILKGQVQQTDEGLMLQFVPTADGYEGFNSAVLAAPIAAQMGGYLTQLHSYDEAFRNMDMYMLMTKEERQAMKMRNKFAAASKDLIYDPTVNQYENKAGWFRPYATFENVGLDNGPRVSNVAYGTYAGGESEMYDLGHGWDGMWGAYVGYNGSHQAYGNHNSIYQNGGTLGVVGMAYKGNFFTGLTINAGANGAEASTMYGSENFSMLMAGIASKTGYNWELANGKFIIQPSALVSYSFVNTFDYRNAAGINISNDPLHAIQIEPGIKFIGNLKNGWQPYASVSVVWNIMDKTHFHANEVALPEMSVKPFVKYGVGVRKSWGERFTAFFQTYFTNGGRNGIGLQAGFRWTIGKAPSKKVKTTNKDTKKTEISKK